MIHAPLAVAASAVVPTDMFKNELTRYTLCKKLSSNLHGETALYEDKAMGKKLVVLKRVTVPYLQQQSRKLAVKENVLSECIVVQLLEDPLTAHAPGRELVVKYVRKGSFSSGESVFIAMEFCAGGDLYDYVTTKPGRRVGQSEALSLFSQLARGLAFLHTLGVAHRDLSLENVLLNDGQVKICDFGQSIDANKLSSDVVGKYYYMAPEMTGALGLEKAHL